VVTASRLPTEKHVSRAICPSTCQLYATTAQTSRINSDKPLILDGPTFVLVPELS